MRDDEQVDLAIEPVGIPDDASVKREYSELDIESAVVAHYTVNLDMSYEDIERMTGLSRATVARRLQHARTQKWLLPPRLAVPPELEERCQEHVRCVNLQDDLTERLRRYGLQKATVVPDRQVMDSEPFEVAGRMGQAAAARILEALNKRERSSEPDRIVIGINWGYSARWTVQKFPQQDSENRDLTFVPLIGNLSVDESHEKEYTEAWLCSANRLARAATEMFRSGPPRRLSTPAIIPRKSGKKQKLETIWELIEEDASYRKTFGLGHHRGEDQQEDTLISRMDTIITGMSALQPTSSLVDMAHLVEHDDLNTLRNAGYVGDLGGRLIYDPEHVATDQDAIDLAESLGALVVSATLEDFRKVARRATEDPWKGVFMIGRGPVKAPALVAACRMGAVSYLFTDRSTAESMIELAPPAKEETR